MYQKTDHNDWLAETAEQRLEEERIIKEAQDLVE